MIYVRNEAESAVSLWLATSNWTPLAALSYMTLIWTYSGRILNADEVIPMKLILDVSPTISGITDFSFDIVINHNKLAVNHPLNFCQPNLQGLKSFRRVSIAKAPHGSFLRLSVSVIQQSQ